MRTFFLVMATVALTACDQADPTSTNENPNNTPAATDNCTGGQSEDANGICRERCSENQACTAADETCDLAQGLCFPAPVPPVCDPATCPEGYACPEDGGTTCLPVSTGECTSDSDCSFGSQCQEGTCTSLLSSFIDSCSTDSDCGFLMTCQFGVCFGCLDDLQCDAGDQCVVGTCVSTEGLPAAINCLFASCGDGEKCNLLSGECESVCSTDEECAAEQMCAPVLNVCTARFGCETGADCLTNLPLCVAGLCLGCGSDAECLPSEQCVMALGQGVCLPRIDGSSGACDAVTCGEDELCDPETAGCYPANGTCSEDAQCRPGQECNFLGFCSGCAEDGDCRSGQRCLFGTCAPIPNF